MPLPHTTLLFMTSGWDPRGGKWGGGGGDWGGWLGEGAGVQFNSTHMTILHILYACVEYLYITLPLRLTTPGSDWSSADPTFSIHHG